MHDYFTWQNPAALRLLWLTPIAAWLLWRAVVKRDRALAAFMGRRYVAADWRWHRRRRAAKDGLVVGALCLLTLAAARPRVGSEVQKVQRQGADVVLLIDVSDSMLAQDVRPNRLEAAKEAAQALAARLPGDRLGIVVFAGSAYMYSPLTVDHDAVSMFLQAIERGSAPAPGTAVQGALGAAVRLVEHAEHGHRAIVLFSDGEDHPGLQLDAVKQAASKGIRVHAVGLGAPEGEPIPLPEGEVQGKGEADTGGLMQRFFGTPPPQGTKSKFKLDRSGNTVLTRMNEKNLTDIARLGGGVFVKSSPSGANIDPVCQAIRSMEASVAGTYEFTQYAERFQWPLGLAILLLLAEGLLSAAPRLPKKVRGVE